jgi:hypothetical protein
MKETEQPQDIIKRQKEEIRALKKKIRDRKEELRFYRRFYMRVMHRYSSLYGLLDVLEEYRAGDEAIASDPHAIMHVNESVATNGESILASVRPDA